MKHIFIIQKVTTDWYTPCDRYEQTQMDQLLYLKNQISYAQTWIDRLSTTFGKSDIPSDSYKKRREGVLELYNVMSSELEYRQSSFSNSINEEANLRF